MKYAVVTSIQLPTPSMLELARSTTGCGMGIIVIGDRKSPEAFTMAGADFRSIRAQAELEFKLAGLLPENHYARKNLGYLLACRAGAEGIYDTDDDNAPLPSWCARSEMVAACAYSNKGWVNAYSYFTSEHIWPRGLPLDRIADGAGQWQRGTPGMVQAPVQQGLVNGSPDVDAIWRLTLDREFNFDERDSLLLGPGAWCPFNSQSTWWFRTAFQLLYLPSHVSFRMTDIWRSFVAQRCLWELGLGVVFHSPDAYQDRNAHNLMSDFEQEIPGYVGNARLCQLLEGTSLSAAAGAVGANLHRCYEALVQGGFIPAREMPLVETWLHDMEQIRG